MLTRKPKHGGEIHYGCLLYVGKEDKRNLP